MALSKGVEMAIAQGLRMAMLAAGIKAENIEGDVLRAVDVVLSLDARLSRIEAALGIHQPVAEIEHNGEVTTDDRRNGHG